MEGPVPTGGQRFDRHPHVPFRVPAVQEWEGKKKKKKGMERAFVAGRDPRPRRRVRGAFAVRSRPRG